ncbi:MULTISPECIES: Omp28-related outer membrane protein [Flavobacterium]|uniref:Omp28-related outer membrane protein n=1 Tax=Flavobacterium TaxID=237 RepID=UPI000745BFA7|nr:MULTISPECIES: Omp28-related outer membrane protein [Flavobacterium]AMA49417.1 hypothetical protein AWN65_08085 [Flavobacterium covae]MCJ1808978.1 Omp28-related outer membrane protein [Flavobacterium covae]OWP81472.1 hypothetical protein BWK63_05765 [Flavobacterium covae]POR23113.1 hypothetical protein BWK57_03455 [Flavobacterium columnare]
MKLSKILSSLSVFLLLSCSKENATSEPISQTNIDNEVASTTSKFIKNALIEDYTGAWCGWCPRVSYSITKVKESTTKVVSVAIHRGSSGGGFDPYSYSGSLPAVIKSFPTGMLNRKIEWKTPQNSYINQVIDLTKDNADLGIAMNSIVDSGNINLDIKVISTKDHNDLKFVVYVVEDGLIFNQSNYTSFYGGGSVIKDFIHNDVLRECLTNIYGDALGEIKANTLLVKKLNIPLPKNVKNVNKMKFVTMILNNNGESLNVREVAPNVNQTFEVAQ